MIRPSIERTPAVVSRSAQVSNTAADSSCIRLGSPDPATSRSPSSRPPLMRPRARKVVV
jgi:hypothetical protein